MTDKEMINALRKCAAEHENEVVCTGQIVASSLCRDVADYLEADRWHYPSKGDNPHVTGSYLVFAEGENGLQYAIGEYFAEENRKRWMNANEWHLELDGVSGTFDPIAWMRLPEPPKEEA